MASGCVMIGSLAMSMRDRLIALLAAYSARSTSRSASAADRSAEVSSCSSVRNTESTAMAPRTMMRATPRFSPRLRRFLPSRFVSCSFAMAVLRGSRISAAPAWASSPW